MTSDTPAHARSHAHPPKPGPLREAVAGLSPGYFALVMSTSIVSLGLSSVGISWLARALLVVSALSYAILWILYLWRWSAYRERALADLRNPATSFAYFTIVAGTGVLGVSFSFEGLTGVGTALLLFGAVLWFLFGYLLPWQVLMTGDGSPILARINGTWFVWAVASQSLAVGMTQIRTGSAQEAEWVGLLAVLSWSVGVALYACIALFVLLRIIQHGISAAEFDPSYWVTMGAMAIAVVAGSNIIDMESTPMVDAARTLIGGTIVVFWCFAAWLIPVLVGAGLWRHGIRRVRLGYEPMLWSMVFPIGMFAMASLVLGRVDGLPAVEVIGHVTLYVGLAVWALVFVGMLHRIGRTFWRAIRG